MYTYQQKRREENVGQKLRAIGTHKKKKVPLTSAVWEGLPGEAAMALAYLVTYDVNGVRGGRKEILGRVYKMS